MGPMDTSSAPFLTARQMAEVDRLMIEELHVGLVQMMELAGHHLAALSRRRFLDGEASGRRVVVLAGTGGNGGGALVCARRLRGWGARVEVALTNEAGIRDVPALQLDTLRRLGVPVAGAVREKERPCLVIDGVIGYSLSGSPRGAAADLIMWANEQDAPVLSLDVPSGVDASSGRVSEPAVWADATLALALPKEGLRAAEARERAGELFLADIGVPAALYARSPLNVVVDDPFSGQDVIRLW